MADTALEGGAVEERRREDRHHIEPAPGLGLVLGDEVRWKVLVEPLLVLEGVVDLGEGHGARFEPAVENVAHSPHGRLAAGVVGVGARQLVDEGSVEIVGPHAEVALELVEAAVDVDARVVGIVALPHRDRRAPESVARDGPIPGALEPLAEEALFHVLGDPVDLAIHLHHALADGTHLHIPGIESLVDERLVGAPAVGIVVEVGLLLDQRAAVPQRTHDGLVGVEDQYSLPVGNLAREATGIVDGAHDRDAGLLAHGHVVLAEARSEVDDARPLFGVDEGAREHHEGLLGALEEGEEGRVAAAHELAALSGADPFGARKL